MEDITSTEDISENDTLKILIATDIHLGYCEKDPIRGNDSFITFDEILKHAKTNEVDFILLGGDLFHDCKPSPNSLHHCIVSLRRFCLGDDPVNIEFLSDQSLNFKHLRNPVVNYEDPNINVSIPVFSIHGNHDDPTGIERLSMMDILADTGLINYFGKWNDLMKIEIHPLLMQKGQTKLALYGLSHIHDQRLSRLFRDKKVAMPTVEDVESWFNVLVLHQNRAGNRGSNNYIPEEVLPSFMDLTIWGHEHDCIIEPTLSRGNGYISQPGSSVATSLSQGESLQKHVGILRVHKKSFKIEPIPLTTVRPFVFKSINVPMDHKNTDDKPSKIAQKNIQDVIESMIVEAETKLTGNPKQPKLPLLRLIVNLSDEQQQFNAIKMGLNYLDRVANPTDMLSLKVIRPMKDKNVLPGNLENDHENQGTFLESMEQLISSYYSDEQIKPLEVLSVRGLTLAVKNFIEKGDKDAIEDIFQHQCNKVLKQLEELDFQDENEIDEAIKQIRLARQNRNEDDELNRVLNDENRNPSGAATDDDEDEWGSADDTVPARPARGRGSRGPRRARAERKTRTKISSHF